MGDTIAKRVTGRSERGKERAIREEDGIGKKGRRVIEKRWKGMSPFIFGLVVALPLTMLVRRIQQDDTMDCGFSATEQET